MKPRKPIACIIYTGGTIGMRWTENGYQPEPGYLESLLETMPEFKGEEIPDFSIVEYDPLLDSSNLSPSDWFKIAQDIKARYHDFDGFVVVHGTDTMAYTSSALSFMLEGLSKPVILTGSQIPLSESRNDARANLLTSLILVGRYHHRLAEVAVFFGNVLLRGNRTTKVNANDLAAFDSPNLPPLGRAGTDLVIHWNLVRQPSSRELSVRELGDPTVGAFRVFPGIKGDYLRALLAPPVQGLVLECFGSGNAPIHDPSILEALTDACSRGVVIVAVCQPLRGCANLDRYGPGKALKNAGVVSGYDMTPEAALAKLYYLFEQGHSADLARELIGVDLRGELTTQSRGPGGRRKA